MLEVHIVTRIQEYLDAELSPRDQTIGLVLMSEQSDAARSGTFGSGRTVIRYSAAGCDELSVRAGIIWTVIRRSYASLNGSYTPTILEDLRQQIRGHIDAQARRVGNKCAERVGLAFTKEKNRYGDMVRKAVLDRGHELTAKLDVEAQFYVDDLNRPLAATISPSVFNFHGSVGAVQTAPFATANVSLAGHEGARLVEALEQMRQAIERNTEATSEQRVASTEIVGDLIVATKAERPNSSKIAGLLGGLGTTVQTTASLQPAWQFVKAAAAAVGLPLP